MTKRELCRLIARNASLPVGDVERVIAELGTVARRELLRQGAFRLPDIGNIYVQSLSSKRFDFSEGKVLVKGQVRFRFRPLSELKDFIRCAVADTPDPHTRVDDAVTPHKNNSVEEYENG